MNALVRRDSIEELVGHRARALELYRNVADTLVEATKAHGRAVAGKGGGIQAPSLMSDRHRGYGENDPDKFVAAMTRRLDQDMWRGLINTTQLYALMDRKEREAFEKSIEENPAAATVENVTATFERLMGESDAIFRRGLVNAFSNLCRDYRSNDGFKIGERTVITWGVSYDKSCNWFRLGERAENELKDVDRVMHVLDGKKAPEYQEGVCAALRQALSDYRRGGSMEVTTPYWRAKFFKNGNVHLFCLRDDLRQKANKIIAEHYGATVGAGPDASAHAGDGHQAPAPRYDSDEWGFFPTPPEVVDMMLARAGDLLRTTPKVLEPSAGDGAIAQAVRAFTHDVWCVEIDPNRAAALRADGFLCLGADFLSVPPEVRIDLVLMNPPFSRQQDIRHVIHAWRFLKPGGRLVAVMSAGVKFRADELSLKFRTLVERAGGTIEDLPEGSFKVSGTNVNTVLVTMHKPEAI